MEAAVISLRSLSPGLPPLLRQYRPDEPSRPSYCMCDRTTKKRRSSPRNTARSPKIIERNHAQGGIESFSGFLPRAAKIDVHAFQGQIDQVRRFLGQSSV